MIFLKLRHDLITYIMSKGHPIAALKIKTQRGAAAYQLGNTNSRTITEVKQG